MYPFQHAKKVKNIQIYLLIGLQLSRPELDLDKGLEIWNYRVSFSIFCSFFGPNTCPYTLIWGSSVPLYANLRPFSQFLLQLLSNFSSENYILLPDFWQLSKYKLLTQHFKATYFSASFNQQLFSLLLCNQSIISCWLCKLYLTKPSFLRNLYTSVKYPQKFRLFKVKLEWGENVIEQR